MSPARILVGSGQAEACTLASRPGLTPTTVWMAMVEATLTLSQALDRAMAGELIAPGETRGTAMTPMEQPERPRQEGNVHHLETQFSARVQMMVAWEMRREAREIVKRRLKAQGVKVSLVSASTITQLANAHLRRHAAELLAAAEASGAVQNLGITISRRRVDRQAKSLCRNQVQNGERYDCRLCSRFN
jgi:phosphoserine phosphatase